MATTAGQFWDKHVRDLNDRVNWWSSDACTAAYNEQVCGQAVPGNSRGCRIALAAAAGRPLGRGVSVGAGAGDKERALLLDGIVGEMRLWELSEARAAEPAVARKPMAWATGLKRASAMPLWRKPASSISSPGITACTTCPISIRRWRGASNASTRAAG